MDADVLIIDEMSMVDLYLMDAVLKAVHPGTRLILVGDSNQLPSVGAGNVLRDIIQSSCINCIQLKRYSGRLWSRISWSMHIKSMRG